MVAVFGERGEGPGQFLDMLGFGLGPDGNLYIVDRVKASIQVFTPAGRFVREIKMPVTQTLRKLEKQSAFQDVAVDDNGDMYVADTPNGCVWVLDSAGAVRKIWGESGFDPNQLKGPVYIDFNPDKTEIVISNSVSTRLNFWTRGGDFIRAWGQKAAKIGSFSFIGGFTFDGDGNVLVVDKAASFLLGFLVDGRYLFSAADDKGEKPVALYLPKTVVAVGDRFFVVEGLMNRVQAFRFTEPAGEPQEEPPAKEE